MKRFDFAPRGVNLDIAGHRYTLAVDAALAGRLKSHGQALIDKAAQVAAGKATDEEAIALCGSILDDLLGGGATEAIFEGREQSFDDHSDILYYIIGEVNAYNEELKKRREHKGKLPMV